MAITLVQSKSATGTSGTTLSLTVNSATTAGNLLVACIGTIDATNNPTVSGITLGGSAGNWASNSTAYNNADTNAAIWADPNCAGGQTAVSISLTGDSGGSPKTAAWIMEWSGLATASPLDKAPAGVNGASTSWSSGSTGTLSQASELAIGCVAYESGAGGTLTAPGSPWTELAQLGTSATVLLAAGYQVVSATAALTYNGTDATGGQYAACIATYKGSSGGSSSAGGKLLMVFP